MDVWDGLAVMFFFFSRKHRRGNGGQLIRTQCCPGWRVTQVPRCDFPPSIDMAKGNQVDSLIVDLSPVVMKSGAKAHASRQKTCREKPFRRELQPEASLVAARCSREGSRCALVGSNDDDDINDKDKAPSLSPSLPPSAMFPAPRRSTVGLGGLQEGFAACRGGSPDDVPRAHRRGKAWPWTGEG